MSRMFERCAGLTTLNMNNWNALALTSIDDIFKGCTGLTELNINGWNTDIDKMKQYYMDSVDQVDEAAEEIRNLIANY